MLSQIPLIRNYVQAHALPTYPWAAFFGMRPRKMIDKNKTNTHSLDMYSLIGQLNYCSGLFNQHNLLVSYYSRN